MKQYLIFLLYMLHASTALYCMQDMVPTYMPHSVKKNQSRKINLDVIPSELIIKHFFPAPTINDDLIIAISQLGYVGTPAEQEEYNYTLYNYITPLQNLSIVNKKLNNKLRHEIKNPIPKAKGVSLMQIFDILGYNTNRRKIKLSLVAERLKCRFDKTFCGIKLNKHYSFDLTCTIEQRGSPWHRLKNDQNEYFKLRNNSSYDILHTHLNKLFLLIKEQDPEFNNEIQNYIKDKRINEELYTLLFTIRSNPTFQDNLELNKLIIKIENILFSEARLRGEKPYIKFTFSFNNRMMAPLFQNSGKNVHGNFFTETLLPFLTRTSSNENNKRYIITHNAFTFFLKEVFNNDPKGPEKIKLFLKYLKILKDNFDNKIFTVSLNDNTTKLTVYTNAIWEKNRDGEPIIPLTLLKEALKNLNQ